MINHRKKVVADKEAAEAAIETAIKTIEVLDRDPTDWQKEQLRHAISSVHHGFYSLAKTCADLAMVSPKEISCNPWVGGKPPDLDQIHICTLRNALERVRGTPPR